MRLALIKAHRWLAWTSGWVLLVVGVSGALYGFEPQIRQLLGEGLAEESAGSLLHPGQLEVQLKRQGFEGSANWFLWPVRGDLPVSVIWRPAGGEMQMIMADPRTGEYLPSATRVYVILQGILEVHRTLAAGETGRWITGTASLLLFASILTGIFISVRRWHAAGKLFLPNRREREHTHPRIRTRLMHRLAGGWLGLGLIILALTGITWSFEWTADFVRWIGGGGGKETDPPIILVEGSAKSIAWDEIWAATAAVRATAGEMRFTVPLDYQEPVRFEWSPPDAPFSSFRSIRYYDPLSARLLDERPVSLMAPGDRLLRWAYPIHTGRIAGWPGQVFVTICALGLPFLLWSGWRYRRERLRK